MVALAKSPYAVVEAQLTHAGLTSLLHAVYSAETARALKPAPKQTDNRRIHTHVARYLLAQKV